MAQDDLNNIYVFTCLEVCVKRNSKRVEKSIKYDFMNGGFQPLIFLMLQFKTFYDLCNKYWPVKLLFSFYATRI